MNIDAIPGWLQRTELLLGKEKLEILRNAHVLVVGLGGVGAYSAEMIARAGVETLTIADADMVYGDVTTGVSQQLSQPSYLTLFRFK